MSYASHAAYVVAVKRRLERHLGATPREATVWIGQHRRELARWQREGVPSDRAARALYDQQSLHENPISQGWLILGAMVSVSAGVYFLLQSLQNENPALAPTPPAAPTPLFTPPVSLQV